jgi:hypothetical protein
MAKIFIYNANKGSYLSTNNILGSITGTTSFQRLNKGTGLKLTGGNSVQWTIPSSTITNLVSLATGNGTLRISCGLNNTDIVLTGEEYNNSVVSYSSITTITVTATSGTVYLYGLRVFNVVSTLELNNIQEEFLQASPIEKPVTGFEYPKPTDLSREVDSVVGNNLVVNGDFATDSDWTLSAGWSIENGLLKANNTSTSIFNIGGGPYVIGSKYKVIFDVSSYTSGSLYTSSNNFNGALVNINLSGTGIYVLELIAVKTNQLAMTSSNLTCEINNLTVQEVSGLVAAYSFSPETVSNGTLLDVSGNSNHGTINGALLTKEGINFIPQKGYIELNSDISLVNNTTICIRVKRANTDAAYLLSSTVGGVRLLHLPSSSNVLNLYNDVLATLTGISKTDFFDLVVAISGTTANTYMNGCLINSVTLSGLLNTTIRQISTSSSTRTWDNIISDLKVYNYTFTPTQAAAYHNSFVKPVLIEDFSNNAVGETNPKGWM